MQLCLSEVHRRRGGKIVKRSGAMVDFDGQIIDLALWLTALLEYYLLELEWMILSALFYHAIDEREKSFSTVAERL